MQITSDFYIDFMNLNLYMIYKLRSQGLQFEEYDDWLQKKGNTIFNTHSMKKSEIQNTDIKNAYYEDLIFAYTNWMERIPDTIPRMIYKCKNFTCPEKYQAGLNLLERKIENGDPLFPHFSKQILDTRINDRMLFNYGISHFHLGIKPDKIKPIMVNRTSDILYAFIDNHNCYFIVIDKHNRWDDEELLQILNNDFPNVLSNSLLSGFKPFNLSDDQRKKARKNNLLTPITIDNDVFSPPGGGTSVLGTSLKARINLDMFITKLNNLEKELIISLNEEQERIETEINKKINGMNLSLIETDPLLKILDKENNLLIEITNFDDNNFSFNIQTISNGEMK